MIRFFLPDGLLTGRRPRTSITCHQPGAGSACTGVPIRPALGMALLVCATLAACSGAPLRHAILRNASFAGIEAKGFVGKPIEEAIKHYGKAKSVQTSRQPAGTIVMGVDVGGKDLYLFEQSRSNYQISVPVGSQTVTTGNGPVVVHQYERQNRVALCEVGLVVEPSTRMVLAADLRGNCL